MCNQWQYTGMNHNTFHYVDLDESQIYSFFYKGCLALFSTHLGMAYVLAK